MRSEPLELSFTRAPVKVGSITGTAFGVRRARTVHRAAGVLGAGGKRVEERTGTKTSLSVLLEDGQAATLDFDTDLRTNVPVEDGNQVSVVFVTGADGVNHLAMLVNHAERASWFVGDARQMATELGAPKLRPWWAHLLLGLGLLILVTSFVSAIAPKNVERHFPSPLPLLAGGVLAIGAAVLIPRRHFGDAVRELKGGTESFAERLLGS
jgi:hypothetical protein